MRARGRSRIWLAAIPLLAVAACGHRGVTPIHTHFNKGVYHYSEGDYDAAISEYRLALEEEPGDHRARFNLAEALEAKAIHLELGGAPAAAEELRQEAEEHYRAILAERPDDLRASVNLAARELELGDGEAAERRLRAAMDRHPRAALPRTALAAHRLRVAAGVPAAGVPAAGVPAAGDPESIRSAIALLEEALRLDGANVDANMLLGHAYATLAQAGAPDPALLGRAREAYRRVLKRDPQDLATLMALARLERLADDPEQAAQWLRRALYVKSDLAEAHLLLSEALDAIGELEGATFHLWQSRLLEDERWPQLAPEEYSRRLLDLYRRLEERERRPGGSPPSER